MGGEDENKGPAWKAKLAECGTEALPIGCPLLASARSVELELASARSVELGDEGGRGANDEDEDGPGRMGDEDENKGPAWKARLAECGTETLPIDCPLHASIGRSRRALFDDDEGGGRAERKR